MADLISHSKNIKAEADKLLSQSELNSFLGSHGDITYTGSYKYGLMYSTDIDVYVTCESPENESIKLLDELIRQRFWKGYMFYDFVNFRSEKRPTYPHGYYIGLKKEIDKITWKVDIWVIGKDVSLKRDEWIINGINDSNRKLILQIKQAQSKKLFDTTSLEIYDAVINKKVKTIDEFKALLNSTNA